MKANSNMIFINSAISDDTTRPFFNTAWYDPTEFRVIATDGRRLHIWQIDANIAKTYHIDDIAEISPIILDTKNSAIHKNQKNCGQCVNYARVIPDYPTPETKKFLSFTKKVQTDYIKFCVCEKIIINPEYFMPLAGETWEYRLAPKDTSVKAALFLSGPLSAIIMPCKLD